MDIQWRSDFDLGIEEIDQQHKDLLNQINALLNSYSSGKKKEEVKKTLDFLAQYVVTHFQCEEGYQRKTNYPGYDEHKKLHEAFLKEVAALMQQFDEQGVTLQFTIQFNKKVVDWLLNHIGKADRDLGKYLKSQAVS